jgi:DNA-directed RNA polymerase subunit RPC12/RpoP
MPSQSMHDLRLDLALHELECPHCQGRTQHSSPGTSILFGAAKCEHCGRQFLIVQNKSWQGDNGSNGQHP